MKKIRTAASLIGLMVCASAGAVTWTTTESISLTSGSIYCSTTTCNTSATGLTGSIMTMSAYSTPGPAGSPTPDTGNWVNARIAIYGGGGVGISNNEQGNSTETGWPQHAIDNNGINDILVVDFGSNNWDVSSFSLGYTCKMNSSGTSCWGSNVNVDAWVGGTSPIDFTTVAFSGSGSGAVLPGFSALSLSPDPGGPGLRTNITADPQPLGRYLVIAGTLGSSTQAFKVSGISANQISEPPSGQVSLPGTLPLLLSGLFGLGALRRRHGRTA